MTTEKEPSMTDLDELERMVNSWPSMKWSGWTDEQHDQADYGPVRRSTMRALIASARRAEELEAALDAVANLLPEDSPDACGGIGVVYDDYAGAHEADDWCHRPRGHSGPHLNIEDRGDFARATLAEGAPR